MAPDLSALREGAWSLDELVDHANRLLAEVLPKDASGRVVEGVNPRLVRHYATQGLVDEPLKEGREARYLYRHLLQLLVVRRLLAEGHTSALAKRVIEGRADEELESLLAGHLTVQLVPERPLDERATFLRRVRARAGLDPAPAPASTPAPASARLRSTFAWKRRGHGQMLSWGCENDPSSISTMTISSLRPGEGAQARR